MRNGKTLTGILFFFLLLIEPAASPAQTSLNLATTARARAAELLAIGGQFEKTSLDCSHFVNSLFDQVGLHYDYQSSRSLYRGSSAFIRIYHPMAGDLIVWPGHVGIIADPDAKTFLSALRRGVRISSYNSRYWRRRGRPRFMRYRLPIENQPTLQARDGMPSDDLKRSGLE